MIGEENLDGKKVRPPLDLFSLFVNGTHTDLVLVSKENLQIRAHKIILSRDRFWHELFRSVECCSGNCATEPTTVVLPDYDYRTIFKMIEGYYKGLCSFESQKETFDFLERVRPFDRNIIKKNSNCRKCSSHIEETDLLEHVLEHVKDSASKDIAVAKDVGPKDEFRCSFNHPNQCAIEKKGTTSNNGDGNDSEDLAFHIREHYRKHLREEVNYLKDKVNVIIPSEETLYHLAEVHDLRRAVPDKQKRKACEEGGKTAKRVRSLPKTDHLSETEDWDKYSGGLSSPDYSDEGAEETLTETNHKPREEMTKNSEINEIALYSGSPGINKDDDTESDDSRNTIPNEDIQT